MSAKSRYDHVIVEDPYRLDAIGSFVEDLVRKKDEQPGLVFVRKKYHAALLSRAIGLRLGVEVPAVTSDTPKPERARLVREMGARRLPVAVCTDVWSTGIDIPRLCWVLLAGAGQAPAGLKQRAGRGTRLHDEKDGYVVYNWEDTGADTESFREQSRQRMEHLRQGGFNVSSGTPSVGATEQVEPGDRETNADVQALGELLAQPAARKPDAATQVDIGQWETMCEDDTHAPWRYGVFIFAVVSMSTMMFWDRCFGG